MQILAELTFNAFHLRGGIETYPQLVAAVI